MKKINVPIKRWMSEGEAVAYTSLSRTTLRDARGSGTLSFRVFGTRHILYERDALDRYLEENTESYLSLNDRLNKKQKGVSK